MPLERKRLMEQVVKLLSPNTDEAASTTSKLVAAGIFVGFSTIFAYINAPAKKRSPGEVRAGRREAALSSDLRILIKILIPSWKCKEMVIISFFVLILTARTLLSIAVAHLDGRVVKSLVELQFRTFLRLSIVWLLMGVPAALCNAGIKYIQAKLAQAFRNRVTRHCYDLYMRNEVFYKVGNLDDRLEHPDQILTDDAHRFCSQLSDLLSQLAKPTFDCFLFTIELWKSVGSGAVAGACFTTVLTAKLLNTIRPAFGGMTAHVAECEGQWRARHSRLIQNAEEIAFHRGGEVERGLLEGSYRNLIRATNKLLNSSVTYNVAEGYAMKYIWGIVGMTVCAAPVLLGQGRVGAGRATEILVTNRKLMTAAADSTERLMESFKEIAHLSGRSGRLAGMLRVFEDVGNGQYYHRVVGKEVPTLMEYKGKVVHNEECIQCINASIVAPNGETLVKSVNFVLRRGDHCLITGPNGCGKSSLFRILAGLWPLYDGELHRPKKLQDIYFLPQRAYLVQGTLRDQIIYPDKVPSCDDAKLREILEWAKCEHVMDREQDGLNANQEWKDVLSGGERQKIGLARVFYHRPKFAILDECTSQIHVDDEELLYSKVKDLGITLMSVSHRRSIWHHHTHALSFVPDGVEFGKFGDLKQKITLEEEHMELKRKLESIPTLRERLDEVEQLLGYTSK